MLPWAKDAWVAVIECILAVTQWDNSNVGSTSLVTVVKFLQKSSGAVSNGHDSAKIMTQDKTKQSNSDGKPERLLAVNQPVTPRQNFRHCSLVSNLFSLPRQPP